MSTANLHQDQDRADIVALALAYVACSSGMDFEGKRAMWDRDEPSPILQPEELHTALVGWPSIDEYWNASRGSMSELSSVASNHVVRLLGPDTCLCLYDLKWTARMRDSFLSMPLAGDNRTTMLLRRKPEGWRVFHYVEASLGLLPVVRRTYQRAAREWFPELR